MVLEAVFVNNASVPFGDGVRVAPGKGSLRFEYTALSLTAPGKVQFRYRLEGFDTDWSEPATSREARYPKVPPGNYRFQVVACNNDGVWNETGARCDDHGCRLLVGNPLVPMDSGAGRGGDYWRRFTNCAGHAAGRSSGCGSASPAISTMTSVRACGASRLLSRMLTKHGKLGAEERQDLEEIHRIAVQTSNSIRDIIWLINPAFDTLQDLVLRTQDFAGTALRGVDYRMNCEGAVLSQKLPFDFRHNLFLFFKEALTNIGRHAQATVVEVRIEERGEGVAAHDPRQWPGIRSGGEHRRQRPSESARPGRAYESNL